MRVKLVHHKDKLQICTYERNQSSYVTFYFYSTELNDIQMFLLSPTVQCQVVLYSVINGGGEKKAVLP